MENVSSNSYQRCYISLKVDGVDTQLTPSSYAFTLFDSIYNFYSKAKLVISDFMGNLNEYLAFVDGTEIEISFGLTEDNMKTCKYTVVGNSVPNQTANGYGFGGTFELNLIHNYFYKQSKQSRAFQDNISSIVEKLVKSYNFSAIDIEETNNSGYWYQPYINDSEFIQNYLLPFAYSSSARNTPFYCFIDSNNGFHFKSFQSMMNNNSVKELTYATDPLLVLADDTKFSTINFAQTELSKLRPWFNCKYFSYDKDSKFIENNDSLLDYIKENGKYPIKGSDFEKTNIVSLYDDDLKLDDTKNNNKGYVINLHNEIMCPDKIIINTIIDTSLTCGKVLTINIPTTKSNNSDDYSIRNSGKYIIESSYHIWDGQKPRTMLVCSKQNVKLNSEYRNQNLLFS